MNRQEAVSFKVRRRNIAPVSYVDLAAPTYRCIRKRPNGGRRRASQRSDQLNDPPNTQHSQSGSLTSPQTSSFALNGTMTINESHMGTSLGRSGLASEYFFLNYSFYTCIFRVKNLKKFYSK